MGSYLLGPCNEVGPSKKELLSIWYINSNDRFARANLINWWVAKSSDVGTRDAIGSKMRFQYIQELPSYKFFFDNVLLWILGVVIIFNMTHGYMQLSSLTHL